MQIIISVNSHWPAPVNGKQKPPTCYFKRLIESHESLTVDLESIVKVLHELYKSIDHTIDIQYYYNASRRD